MITDGATSKETLQEIEIFHPALKKILPLSIRTFGDPPKHTLIKTKNQMMWKESVWKYSHASSIPMEQNCHLIYGSLKAFVDIWSHNFVFCLMSAPSQISLDLWTWSRDFQQEKTLVELLASWVLIVISPQKKVEMDRNKRTVARKISYQLKEHSSMSI